MDSRKSQKGISSSSTTGAAGGGTMTGFSLLLSGNLRGLSGYSTHFTKRSRYNKFIFPLVSF